MSQFDFSNVRAAEVPADRTRTFTFYRLEGAPSLTVKPIGEANPAYMRAMLQGSKEALRKMNGRDLTPEILHENRQKDRVLFPRYVIVGWEGVLDASGEPVPFSAEACAAFVAALPYDIFNELRDFCSVLDNFRGEDEVSDEDTAAIVGN